MQTRTEQTREDPYARDRARVLRLVNPYGLAIHRVTRELQCSVAHLHAVVASSDGALVLITHRDLRVTFVSLPPPIAAIAAKE